jgi:hypothetical protein
MHVRGNLRREFAITTAWTETRNLQNSVSRVSESRMLGVYGIALWILLCMITERCTWGCSLPYFVFARTWLWFSPRGLSVLNKIFISWSCIPKTGSPPHLFQFGSHFSSYTAQEARSVEPRNPRYTNLSALRLSPRPPYCYCLQDQTMLLLCCHVILCASLITQHAE